MLVTADDIQAGAVRFSGCRTGEATGRPGPGDRGGRAAAQRVRMARPRPSAGRILVVPKDEMIPGSARSRFLIGSSSMLSRNIRIVVFPVDQLFNSSEKRLARTLLLRRHGRVTNRKRRVAQALAELLAEMIGTT
jgi:hypothetical protein